VRKRYGFVAVLTVAVWILPGCVERVLTIHSEPSGAVVWLNGEEAGVTPLTTSFTWYGTYEVVVRKDGYRTLRTGQPLNPPFYQWPVVDLFTECLLPVTLTDRQEWNFTLQSVESVEPNELMDRARQMQGQVELLP